MIRKVEPPTVDLRLLTTAAVAAGRELDRARGDRMLGSPTIGMRCNAIVVVCTLVDLRQLKTLYAIDVLRTRLEFGGKLTIEIV